MHFATFLSQMTRGSLFTSMCLGLASGVFLTPNSGFCQDSDASARKPGVASIAAEALDDGKKDEKWLQLFNGKDLDGWTPKIRYHKLGENFGDTFRVKDGMMQVRYDEEAYPKFGEKFGHIFYKTPYSHYRLRVEYRFVGEQCKDGPGWATRNSGLMLHCENPKDMAEDQDFPASIEYQILGGDGQNRRTTANLCTPGTNVVMKDELIKRHCTSSVSKTYHSDQWVTCEVEVRGGKTVKHIMDGQVVLSYDKPQLDASDAHSKELIEQRGGNLLLEEGYISLQSESHPCDFRKVELLVLQP